MAYITLEDAKSHIGIDSTAEDTEVQRALDAAVNWVDVEVTHRTFTVADPSTDTATSRIYKPDRSRLAVEERLWVDDLVDIDTLEKQTTAGGAWETVNSGDYELRPLNANADGWPYTHIAFTTAQSAHRVRVTGWFGWPATPNAVKEATLLQTSFLYRRRETPFGISQTPDLEGGGMRLRSKGDPNAESLLAPYIRGRVLV